MNTHRTPSLLAAILSVAVFTAVGGAPQAKPAAAADPVVAAAPVADARWSDIEFTTFELRAKFFTGLDRLEVQLDNQILALKAKRATMKGTTSTKDWDWAMKEMDNSHAYLTAMGKELAQAGPDTWNQMKDRVGLAWVRTQNACQNVKASTTD
jgi:hypothetical protein